jgi:hypothetical protein
LVLWLDNNSRQKNGEKKVEYLAIARQTFGDRPFTAKQLFENIQQKITNPPTLRTVQRALKEWENQKTIYRLGDTSSTQYTLEQNQSAWDVSIAARRFEQFKTESQWKPSERGNDPVFGHPTKKKNNNFYPYQISSPRAFQSLDYLNFFKTTKNETFSDEIARRELNRAIANKKLSKVGSDNARTYAITQGEPGYSSYVVSINRFI